ncbi:MAG: 2-succinyl-5-enolpyruvyl-6-hydroxy-3-cyclohexene-1-carboxylic-acid synthase [Bdellovibrionales bacterium]|nr:2-succinyl-5-enolpyruvyl-6-hydroxy-3-cyclohexene-1-carboxylic-acid synthase [Bdellovibrionales bacterium]
MNLERAGQVLQLLYQFGVDEVVCCAGARNAPFIKWLSQTDRFQSRFHFEERSAGFYALGRIQKLRKPVAVFTTSGTAVAELLPAVVEAHYQGLPLIVVSSDRPKEFRGTGSPQTIEQNNIFQIYAKRSWDLTSASVELDLAFAPSNGPLHINICFSEPLLTGEIGSLEWTRHSRNTLSASPVRREEIENLRQFFHQVSRPMAIVNSVPQPFRERLIEELCRLRIPTYLEGAAGLSGESRMEPYILKGEEDDLRKWASQNEIDGVLRFGGVPTLRFWRDLETKWRDLPVLSVSQMPFTGLSRIKDPALSFHAYFECRQSLGDGWERNWWPSGLVMPSLETVEQWQELSQRFPKSEWSGVFELQKRILPDEVVFVGNSLPIRHWDFVSSLNYKKLPSVYVNRGTNGIDGLISSMFGVADENRRTWGLIGDLSALYDLSALSLKQWFPEGDVKLVVINNGGGKIFSRLFSDPAFENRHTLRFKGVAEMFNWKYSLIEDFSQWQDSKGCELIEWIPSEVETHDFMSCWSKK